MGVAEDARATQARAIGRSDRAVNVASGLWRRVDPADLDGSWESVSPQVEAAAAAAIRANAVGAGRFTNSVAVADRLRGDVLVPDAFVGVDGSGRSLGSLLRGAVTTTKQGVAAGMSLPDAMMTGGAYLTVMLKSAIADLERSASLAAASGKGYVRYVRLVNPGACSRCAILAGSDRYRAHFERHPGCRCSTVPMKGDAAPSGLFDTPGDYFESLSPAEQERVFTKAGAEAIRLGADPVRVVNARSGAKRMTGGVTFTPSRIQRAPIGTRPDGSQVMGYVTVEGTSRRGEYGQAQIRLGAAQQREAGSRYRTVVRPRLMPESIVELTDDVDMRRVLLRDAGYLAPMTPDMSNNAWVQARWAQQERDRATADDFYRSVGIRIG